MHFPHYNSIDKTIKTPYFNLDKTIILQYFMVLLWYYNGIIMVLSSSLVGRNIGVVTLWEV